MGKYIGSPWGQIRGKLNGSVGIGWKGIDSVRKLVLPSQRGTIKDYKNYLAGLLSSRSFSYKQMNIRQAILSPLGYVARMNLEALIIPVWEEFVTKHGYKMSGLNAFVKANAATLYASMPHSDQEYDASTNAPDLTQMRVADGDLEGTPLLTAVYTTGTGALAITWDEAIFGNGALTDVAYVCVVRKPILESTGVTGTWAPKLHLYGILDPSKTRDDESASVTLPTGLTAADMVAFLFFRDAAGTIGYSVSYALQVTAP